MSIDINESETSPRYSAPALEKGLDILEYLSATRSALSLSDVCDGLGRTRSEIFRMVAVLEARGYIERETPDRFVVADKLFRLGLNRPIYRSLLESALPVMRAFAEETGYSCHLAVASDTSMVVVARVESVSHIGFSVRVGYRQPLIRTGSGRNLLAFMSEPRRIRTLEAIGREHSGEDAKAFEVELETVRRSGFVVRPSSIAEGVTDISAPVFDREEGGAVAALTCPHIRILNAPIEPDVLLERVRDAARQIGFALSGDEAKRNQQRAAARSGSIS
ncbi:IclR family transcriptional regulator [Aureimonas sp. ME7]|uniref:IclR family transcriptional regulator n=1 Tax=Aureimonas sp. ME7 TaxID=2744252 RepID=UPI0015F5F289|nr:IclR family transcriptional regulator [Aureimonas sp. ME7]